MARGLRWLPDRLAGEFDTLRKIRNIFAHSHKVYQLRDARLADMVRSLEKREQVWRQRDGYRNAYDAAPFETQLRLRLFCAGMLAAPSRCARSMSTYLDHVSESRVSTRAC